MVAAVTAATATDRTDAGRTAMATNFETFLTLLTAQLKNQDPLSPVDSNEFTSQLTQSGGLSGAANYIGKDTTAAWSAMKLDAGKATWSYELATDAATADLQVLDGGGRVVWSGPAPNRTEGTHDFVWDGKTSAGGQLPDGGVYTLKVTAKTGSDETVTSQTLVRGRITGVELYNGEPYLTVGNSILPLSSVIALQERAAPVPPAGTA